MRLCGVDGCKGGWVVAGSDASLRALTFAVFRSFEAVLGAAEEDLIVVDVPIGLPADGPRACDQAARGLLGSPRNSSVFSPPCRAALHAATYRDACDLNLAACGKMVSRQLFGILPKIREVDALITPQRQRRVREAHPEVIFANLAGTGRGLRQAKKSPAGRAERLSLLGRFVPDFDPRQERGRLGGPRVVADDDIIDAVACLVTARRIVDGMALVLPAGAVPFDSRGLRMEIVA
jgi:predicted RNase H-like nuclease